MIDSIEKEEYSKRNQISHEILSDMLRNNISFREDLPNKKYLDTHLVYLERMVLNFKNTSEDPTKKPRERAHARDLMQNSIGLINGIKYAVSFLDHKDIDLFNLDVECNEVSENV